MLTFFLLPDMDRFLKLVRESRGQVLLNAPDGSQCDLKHSGDARQALELAKSEDARVVISLSDRTDMQPFIQYMTEAAFMA